MITKKNTVENSVTSVNICLADPHSGFVLWKDTLDRTSDYKATQNNFHTFRMISDDQYMAGIRFPLPELPDIFLKDVLENVEKVERKMKSDSSFDHGPLDGEARGERRTDSPRKKILKTEISRPCMFTHVTSAIEIKKDENVGKGVKVAKVKQK